MKEPFRSAGEIVEEVTNNALQNNDIVPKPSNLIRMTNKHRQRRRPTEPKDLNFEVKD